MYSVPYIRSPWLGDWDRVWKILRPLHMPRTYMPGGTQPAGDSQLESKGGSSPNGWLRQHCTEYIVCMYGIVTGRTSTASPANHHRFRTRWEAPALPVTRDVDASWPYHTCQCREYLPSSPLAPIHSLSSSIVLSILFSSKKTIIIIIITIDDD